jgi:branched-chain amino acid transport system permease protein
MSLREPVLHLSVIAASDPAGIIINIIVWFGLMLIVALAFNHVFGSAGLPALSNRIPILIGAYTVSAVSLRVIFAVVAYSGVRLLPYNDDMGWIYNNPANVALVNDFLADNPALGVGLLIFSLGASMVLGGLGGWLMARAALRLDAIYILILTLSLTDIGCLFGRNITWLGGGTLGLYIPAPLALLGGNESAAMAAITLAVVVGVYLILRRLSDSPWGRLLAATRDNPMTTKSVGKDLVAIRGRVIFYTSGLMALAGALNAFYISYVVEASYHNAYWMFWPLLMILLGGLGSSAGTVLGAALIIGMREAILIFKFEIGAMLFFPISYLEDVLLGGLILIVLIWLPRGLIPEKRKQIRGIAYGDLVDEDRLNLGDK